MNTIQQNVSCCVSSLLHWPVCRNTELFPHHFVQLITQQFNIILVVFQCVFPPT